MWLYVPICASSHSSPVEGDSISESDWRLQALAHVSALLVRGFDRVAGDLAALGYDLAWGVFRASDVGAPHRRERVFALAHATSDLWGAQRNGGSIPPNGAGHRDEGVANADRNGLDRERVSGLLDREREPWPPAPDDADGWCAYLERNPGAQPAVRRGTDGLANRVDRLRLTGNGVVPAVAAVAFRVLAERLGIEP